MIAIIGAMDTEVSNLKSSIEIDNIFHKANMDFVIGKLSGKNVIVVKSGIGKVNAAICTQIVIDLGAKYIINTGIAGGLTKDINIGDIILSTDCVQHDVDAQAFGYIRGQIPQLDVFGFEASQKLIELAQAVCIEEKLPYSKGRVVTGDRFVSDSEIKSELVSSFNAICTEMEGAAIAQTAYLNDIPFLIIRSISDNADGNANVDFAEFEQIAVKNSNIITERLVEAI